MLQIPELLAPAGDLERLRYAINYGADAVYCSLPEFGMRSAPANFTPEQLAEGVIYAHARGRKVYLTMNTLPTNEEADRLPEAIKSAAEAGVDAFIVADLGVLDACKHFAPDIDVHMSTQTGITNWAAARAAYNMGAKRVVLAREMTLQDIATLRDKTPPELEIEAFVHGAMCMSVSGRCLLSNYMAGRDANRGQCAQPCRWKYYLSEETRPGQLYEIGENENGSFIFYHFRGCHDPYTMDENGNPAEFDYNDQEHSNTLYSQLRGDLKMIKSYMQQLDDLGLLDDTTIIVTADHGRTGTVPDLSDGMSRCPTLWVKPAGADRSEPMQISDKQVSQDNMRSTVLDCFGLKQDSDPRTLDEIGEDEELERYFWAQCCDESATHRDYNMLTYRITGDATDMNNWELVSTERIQCPFYDAGTDNPNEK